jgi:integrase
MAATGDRSTKRKDRLFQGMHTAHTPDGPKRKYIYGRRKKDVERKLAEAMGDAARGIVFDSKGETVGALLTRWLEDVVEPNKTHHTYATHRQQVRSHIIPAIGRIKLDALRKAHVDRLYSDLLRGGLAPSSVRRVHAVLHAALEEAVRGDLIPRNPSRHATSQRFGKRSGNRSTHSRRGRSSKPRAETATKPSTSSASWPGFGRERR